MVRVALELSSLRIPVVISAEQAAHCGAPLVDTIWVKKLYSSIAHGRVAAAALDTRPPVVMSIQNKTICCFVYSPQANGSCDLAQQPKCDELRTSWNQLLASRLFYST